MLPINVWHTLGLAYDQQGARGWTCRGRLSKARSQAASSCFASGHNTSWRRLFLRIQEYYESPRFHGRVFSLEQYMDWYAEEYGNFTYYQDWSGFNVPSTELEPFYAGRFDPLSGKEERLLGMFRNVRGRFYMQRVIAQAIADHEAAKAKTAKGTRVAVSST